MNSSSPVLHAAVQPAEPPLAARRLGHAGLIPFVLGAVLVWLVSDRNEALTYVTLALSGYAATIVAFLGGVHWGLAMQTGLPGHRAFGWAMVPPLVAWIGVIMPAHAGLVVLGVMLLVCYGVDRRLYTERAMGHWLTLRFRLSAVAALSCFLAAAGI